MWVLNIFQRYSVGLFVVLTLFLSSCGGGGGSSSNPPTEASGKVTLSGVVQKGPLIKNSTVTAQELDTALSPNGKQYTYYILDDLGRFDPTGTTFTSLIISLNANGYYYDEVINSLSSGPLTLQGISDLDTDTVMNVNLLSTLAYNRIKTLVGTGMTIAAARAQAEAEVLKAFYIYNGNAFGSFGSLDISKHRDGDNILAAISSLFVNGNDAGNLSMLIANFQSDLSDNGVIDTQSIKAALATSASTLAPATVAANLSAKYTGVTTAYATKDISDWIDNDDDGVISRYEFQVPDSGATTAYTIQPYVADQLAGSNITLSAGTLSINDTVVTGPVTVKSGDIVTVSPPAGSFTTGVLDAYLLKNGTRIAKVSFLSGPQSIAITPANASAPNGLTQKLTATVTFTDSSTQALSGATWASNNTAVATVDTSGTVTGKSVGSATISATFSGITGSIIFNVTPAVLASITVSNPNISLGLSQQLTATGVYSDTTTADITSSVSWSSATPSVATVSASGLATGVSSGTASLTATSGAISGSATINVTSAVLQSIAITPSLPTVALGLTQQFTATGTYSNSTTQTLTGVTWTSGTPSVATINGTGLVSTLAQGTSLISATSGTISGSTTLTVTGLSAFVWDNTNWDNSNWQ